MNEKGDHILSSQTQLFLGEFQAGQPSLCLRQKWGLTLRAPTICFPQTETSILQQVHLKGLWWCQPASQVNFAVLASILTPRLRPSENPASCPLPLFNSETCSMGPKTMCRNLLWELSGVTPEVASFGAVLKLQVIRQIVLRRAGSWETLWTRKVPKEVTRYLPKPQRTETLPAFGLQSRS